MKSILIVEDETEIIEQFKINLDEHNLYFAQTAPEANNVLFDFQESPFDYIFLDHDLDINNTGKNGEGIDVANIIIRLSDFYNDTTVVIHSMNPVGADNMFKVIDRVKMRVIKLPYSWIVWNKWEFNL